MNRICYHCEGCKDQEKGASGKEFLAASYHERRRERDDRDTEIDTERDRYTQRERERERDLYNKPILYCSPGVFYGLIAS